MINVADKYINVTNYEVQMHTYNNQNKLSSDMQMYYKDGSVVMHIKNLETGNKTIYINGNWYNQLKFYATTKITSDRYNGKECYCISVLEIMWVDKETGLILKEIPDEGYTTIYNN